MSLNTATFSSSDSILTALLSVGVSYVRGTCVAVESITIISCIIVG